METMDLIVKKVVFTDWKDLLQNVLSQEESAKYLLWNPIYDEEHARDNIKKTIEFQRTFDAWLVYEKKSNQAIGWAGVTEVEEGVWEDCGIVIGPDFTGKGYGKQLLQCLICYVFEEKKANKMLYSCRSGNEVSRLLCQSLGFVYVASEMKTDPRNREPYTLEYYELVRQNG